jgi:hypothetical protein
MMQYQNVVWSSDGVKLHNPSESQFKKAFLNLTQRYNLDAITLWRMDCYNMATAKHLTNVSKHPVSILGLFQSTVEPQILPNIASNNKWLQTLWIDKCSLTDTGVQLLCVSLSKNCTLSTLWLTNDNTIADNSVRCLTLMLQSNKSIKQLSLVNCGISDVGVYQLTDVINNKTLNSLNLAGNQAISSNGVGFVIHIFTRSRELNELHLYDISITDDKVDSFCSLLKNDSSTSGKMITLSSKLQAAISKLSYYQEIKDRLTFVH